MSSIIVISSIVGILAILVCYAFLAQSIQQKKEARSRLKIALQTRARTFKHMLEGFPKGFLPNELTMLLQKSLIDIYGQLTELEPDNAHHTQALQMLTQEMAQAQQQQGARTVVEIKNPETIKETKACLEELYKFVFQIEGNKRVDRVQADAYRAMIKVLVTRLSVDGYLIQASSARSNQKTQLAVHYYKSAADLMERENSSGEFTTKIETVRGLATELSEGNIETSLAPDIPSQTLSTEPSTDDEWGNYEANDDLGKKRQVYD